jgi:hypothetical protein
MKGESSMAVRLIANYAKKLGLPGYSSHQFSVSVETELSNVTDVAGEAERLYQQLQSAVDKEIQQPGFVPPHEYGMAENGNRPPANGNGQHRPQNGNGANANGRSSEEPWACSQGQREFVLRLCHDYKLDKAEIEAQAQRLFQLGMKQLNKLQMSQMIDDILEQNGRKQNGSRWRSSGNRQQQGARA